MANVFKNLFTGNSKLNVDQLIVKKTITSFFFFFVLIGAALWGWKWFESRPMEAGVKGGIRQPLRDVMNLNEKIFNGLLSDRNLAKEYPASMAVKRARVNGDIGMSAGFDTASWQMLVIKANEDTLRINMEAIKKLPKTEVIFNFKCIEGWSEITHWGGVRFSDFVKAYGLNGEASMHYLGLETPDHKYYVGIDMASALHPQTLLCYELNDQPLPMNQGYPLRLIIPVKYGVKSLKRIGTMYFANKKPRDYWAEKGYDYFTGL